MNGNIAYSNYMFYGFLILLLIAWLVASDARQFGQSGLFWALLVMFMPIVGIIMYMIVRSGWVQMSYAQQYYYQAPPKMEDASG